MVIWLISNSADVNQDDVIEYAELLQISCNCANEINNVFQQLSPNENQLDIELLKEQKYFNSFDFDDADTVILMVKYPRLNLKLLFCFAKRHLTHLTLMAMEYQI